MAFPKQVKPYTADFINVGSADESLRISWTYPYGVPSNILFKVGEACFLEDPSSASSMVLVPDEHIIASVSMLGILAGGLLIGSKEWKDAFTQQDAMNLQTIVGLVKLKDDPVWIGTTPIPGGLANLYNVTFYRSGQVNNTRTVEMDTYTCSTYDNRIDNPANSVYCVPGAIFKEFPTLKKSNLGVAESQNRIDVQNFVADRLFWV